MNIVGQILVTVFEDGRFEMKTQGLGAADAVKWLEIAKLKVAHDLFKPKVEIPDVLPPDLRG